MSKRKPVVPPEPVDPWRHSIRKFGLLKSIDKLRAVDQATEDNMVSLCRAFLAEKEARDAQATDAG